jgi:hypothetical protein
MNTFHLVDLDRRGAIVSELKLSRSQLEALRFLAQASNNPK